MCPACSRATSAWSACSTRPTGPFVNVLVGATIVGSVATVWHGVVNPPRTRDIREWRYDSENIVLHQGAEMGRFLLGSTVVMLFPKNVLTFVPDWAPSRSVRLGEAMAMATAAAAAAVRTQPRSVSAGTYS